MQGGDNEISETKLSKKKHRKKKKKLSQFLAFLILGVLAIGFGLVEVLAGNLPAAILGFLVGIGFLIAGGWS
jgi:hypothetical protein